MGKSQGKTKSPTGLYWCNTYLSDNKLKLCAAELIDKEVMIFRLWSNCSKRVINDNSWNQSTQKIGWWYKDMFEGDVNQFFNY